MLAPTFASLKRVRFSSDARSLVLTSSTWCSTNSRASIAWRFRSKVCARMYSRITAFTSVIASSAVGQALLISSRLVFSIGRAL